MAADYLNDTGGDRSASLLGPPGDILDRCLTRRKSGDSVTWFMRWVPPVRCNSVYPRFVRFIWQKSCANKRRPIMSLRQIDFKWGYLSVMSWNGDFRESGLWLLSSSVKRKKGQINNKVLITIIFKLFKVTIVRNNLFVGSVDFEVCAKMPLFRPVM